jgi:hypothetical protein
MKVYRFDIINQEDTDLFCIDETIFVLAYNPLEAKQLVHLEEKYEIQEVEGPCVISSVP